MASGVRRGKKLIVYDSQIGIASVDHCDSGQSGEGQLWGNAMLRELDFIQGDWADEKLTAFLDVRITLDSFSRLL